MQSTRYLRSTVPWLAAGVGFGVASYLGCVGTAWLRYGHSAPPASSDETDPLLDRFMPEYEVAERHHIGVAAPAAVTFAAATGLDLTRSSVIRAIFKTRELVLRSRPDPVARPRALLAQMTALGWGVLAEIPDREIVMGAATQPWMATVVMRALPADQFAAFHEPGYVKIVWTLRADPIGSIESVARTETRVATTDPTARAKFRRYWSFFSPGIILIRRISLGLVKKEAERRTRTSERAYAEAGNKWKQSMQ
jgi:hypothetical protein